MNTNSFLTKLNEETEESGKDEVSKHLAKEDSLRFVADFIKKVNDKVKKPADRIEIYRLAEKTLQFYIDQIESDGVSVIDFDEIPDFDNEGEDEGEDE